VEATTLEHPHLGVRGPTPLLRLQGDERLVTLTRKGNQAAYEALVARYQSRLLAFCRHMLSSKEDAEDVLQEVFAAAFNALMADNRPINVRPWLYRIARNRSLNHLRRQQAIGVDSMDVHFADHGKTTVEHVQGREAIRELLEDVKTLPETQRTALLLREIDALSYEQISEAMETTVPSVKSLLVRARVSLAEAAEARALTCDNVREELGEAAEGLHRLSPPARRHVRTCDSCAAFKSHLKQNNKALAAIFPVGPLIMLKKFLLAQVGTTAASGSAAGAGGGAAAAGASAAAGAGAGSALTAGVGAVATKAAAGLAAVAIVGAGAVEVDHAQNGRAKRQPVAAAKHAPAIVAAAPTVVSSAAQPVVTTAPPRHRRIKAGPAKPVKKPAAVPAATTPAPATTTTPATTTAPAPQQESDATALPPSTTEEPATTPAPPPPTTTSDPQSPPPATTTDEQPPPPTTTDEQPPPPPPPSDQQPPPPSS
jgi:RNA polymerase sigma factor (sigma-70 family)